LLKEQSIFHDVKVGRMLTKAPSTLRRGNLQMQQLPVILDLCFKKARSGKSHDYRDAIVFEKFRFQNVFRPRENKKPASSNFSGLKSVSESFVLVTD